MDENENMQPLENHLGSRSKKNSAAVPKDLNAFKKVYKFFHQLKIRSHNLELLPRIFEKLQTQNDAYKKLLSFRCEKENSPINKYLDELWEKRFRNLE